MEHELSQITETASAQSGLDAEDPKHSRFSSELLERDGSMLEYKNILIRKSLEIDGELGSSH